MNPTVRISYQRPDLSDENAGVFSPADAVVFFREFDWNTGLAEMRRLEQAGLEFCPPHLLFYREDLPGDPYFSVFPSEGGTFVVQVCYQSTKRFLGIFPGRRVTKTRDSLVGAQAQNMLERYVKVPAEEMNTVADFLM